MRKIDYLGEVKLARTLAERAGLNLVFSEEETAKTDGRTIYVQKPSLGWSEEQWIMWKSCFYHEIGHNVPEMRDCFDFARDNKIDMGSFYGGMINCLDDFRQERYKYDEFDGKRSAMSKGNALFRKRLIEDPEKGMGEALAGEFDSENKYGKVLATMLAYDTAQREDWQPDCSGLGSKMYNLMDDEAKEWFDKLQDGKYMEPLKHGTPKATDVGKQVDSILSEVFQIDPEEEKKKAQESFEAKHGQGGEDGEEGEGEAQKAKGKESDEKGEGDTPAKSYEDSSVKWDDVLLHTHDENEMQSSYSSLDIDYEGYDHSQFSDYEPYSYEEHNIVHYPSNKMLQVGSKNRPGTCEAFLRSPEEEYMRIMSSNESGEALSRKIERLLMIVSRDRYKFGKKRGKLHNKNLYRTVMRDARGFNERIFRQKEKNDTLDTAVTILMDCSGSMGGLDEHRSKFMIAGHSLVLLNEMLKPLRVPYELLGFTQMRGPVDYIYKGFGDRPPSKDSLVEYICKSANCMMNNCDYDSVAFAYNRIRQQRSKRKVLIVLSDGQPAGDKPGDLLGATQDLVKGIEEEKIVEIYGVGIKSNSVTGIYSQREVISKISELDSALLKLVKKKIMGA